MAGSQLLDVVEGSLDVAGGSSNGGLNFSVGSLEVFGRVFAKVGHFLWFFCGEDVVECVVNLVRKPRRFDGGKIRRLFHFFFTFFCHFEKRN
ncbi:hypothetical protein [Tunturiibacter psychrotolerans]|uniref:hypothetical protein n=1 Tax=Tunturiibacter psychrotolerans TaxID=3069686 RepID=UPI003D19D3B5